MADNDKPGILRNLRVKRVSLVDIGANFDTKTGDGAHIMLFKAAVNKNPSVGSVHVDSTDWRDDYEKATLDSTSRNKLPDSAFAAVWTDSKGVKQRKLPIHDAGHLAAARGRLAAADIPADVKAAARRKIDAATNHKEKNVKKSILQKMLGLFNEKDETKRAASAEEITKALNDLNDNDDDVKKVAHDASDPNCKCADCMGKRFTGDPEAINLAVSKATTALEKKHAEQLAIVTKQATDAMAAVEVEKQARLTAEMTSVLKSFRHVPMDLEKDIPAYIALKAANPTMFDSILAKMRGTEALLAKSALFENFGSNQEGQGDAWAAIEAKADALVEKSTSGLTREQAIEKVMLDPKNMSLVKQYRNGTAVQ